MMNTKLNCCYSIIPDLILENKELNSTEKLVMAMIFSLTLNNNECYASNKYFSEKLGLSKRTITNLIASLKEKKLIRVETINYQRYIYLSDNTRKTILGDIDVDF